MSIPQGYKQTEVGIIPEDWKLVRLHSLGCVYTGLSGKRKEDFGHGTAKYIPFLNILTNPQINIRDLELVNVSPNESQNAVKAGDLFFNTSSETPEEVGMCSVLTENIANTYLNSFCFGYRLFDKGNADGVFLSYYFRSTAGRELMSVLAQGATRYNLAKTAFLESKIILPPIEEQRRIAEVLSDVDGLITAFDKRIAKKKLIKQAAMQQLLTGKKRLQGFTDEWSNRTFQQIFQHISTHGYHIDASEYTSVGKTPIIDQGKDLIIGYTNKKSFECPHKGVIVFGDHTRIFKYVDFNFCVGADGTQVLMCNDGFDTKYIYYICSSAEIPNTGYNRHFKFLKEYDFFISPNIEEQQAIATILSDMDAEISDLERKRDKYKLLKNGIMQKLLTGQIRIK